VSDQSDIVANDLDRSQVMSDLLILLADAKEEAEWSHAQCRTAESDAARLGAEAESLRVEIDGMTSTVEELQRRLHGVVGQLAEATARSQRDEETNAQLGAELAAAQQSEQTLRRELDLVHQSRAWKAASSLRRVRSGVIRGTEHLSEGPTSPG
jgi:predicted RNase H-like nuclease (RuvC/YqgF family)